MDTPDEKGTTARKRYQHVIDTMGTVPPQLANEIKAEPHEEILLDLFFDIYQPEQNPYLVIHAYCQLWNTELDGEDLILLKHLWSTAEGHRAKTQKERMEKTKKDSGGKSKPPRRGRPPRR